MEDLLTYLRVEGTTRLRVLVYGLVKRSTADKEKAKLDAWASAPDQFFFEHGEWSTTVVLREFEFPADKFRSVDIGSALDALMHSPGYTEVCFCMLDGAFINPGSVFREQFASIYAFLKKNGELNIAMSGGLRMSSAWRREIGELLLLGE